MPAPTIDTFNALTQEFWIEKSVQDIVMRDTPTLRYMQKYQRAIGGEDIVFDIEYARLTGAWKGKTDPIDLTPSGQLATKAKLSWMEAVVPVSLWQRDIEANRNEPRKIASYFDLYVRSAMSTMKEVIMAPALWTPQAGDAMWSLADAIGDSTPYADINIADVPQWRSIITEPDYDTVTAPLAPCVENVIRMIRASQNITGRKPEYIVTSTPVYDRLAEQLLANDQVSAVRSNQIINWGFDALHILNVPVTDDLYMEAALCSDFDPAGVNRAGCGGHQMFFMQPKNLQLMYQPGRNMSWDPEGWRSSLDYQNYLNKLYFWGTVGCTNRRNQGRIFGIDPEMEVTDPNWKPVSPDLTPFIS